MALTLVSLLPALTPAVGQDAVKAEIRQAALAAAIAEVQAGRRTTPLINGPTPEGDFIVTFLAESRGGEVPRIVSDATGWGEDATTDTFDFNVGKMARIGRTNWYSLDARIAPCARVEYFVVHGRDYEVDPYNPRRQERHIGGAASEFVTPGYTPPERWDAPEVPAGKTTATIIESRALGGSRRVIVYLPPGHRPNRTYPLTVFLDGVSLLQGGPPPSPRDPTGDGPAIEPVVPPRLLDHLIARGEIEPVVGVFLESQRFGDLHRPPVEAMRTFLISEVPAWAGARYRAGSIPEKRAIVGRSAGARVALDAALAQPVSYGRVGLLIPARRVALEADLVPMIAKARPRMRVAILAGLYDHADLPTARALRRALTDAGHAVEYLEVPEGHTPTTWQGHLREVLVALFRSR